MLRSVSGASLAVLPMAFTHSDSLLILTVRLQIAAPSRPFASSSSHPRAALYQGKHSQHLASDLTQMEVGLKSSKWFAFFSLFLKQH